MPVKTVTTAATRVALATTTFKVARLTIQRQAANTGTIFVGFPVDLLGSGNTVSSTVYDCYLDANNPSVTYGMGDTEGNTIDLTAVWLDASVSGEGVAYFVEPI